MSLPAPPSRFWPQLEPVSVSFAELLGEPADLAQGRQVRQQAFDGGVAGLGPDLLDRGLSFGGIAAHQDDRRPAAGQLPGGDEANSGRGAGHEADLAAHGDYRQARSLPAKCLRNLATLGATTAWQYGWVGLSRK